MCDEADEYFSVYNERRVRARKPHVCCACKETIRTRDVYVRTFTVFEGVGESYKHCLRCNAMLDAIAKRAEYGAAIAFKLDCGELWSNNFGPVPDGVARLAFLTPDEQQAILRVEAAE